MLHYLTQLFLMVLPILVGGIIFIVLLKKNRLIFLNIPLDNKKSIFGKRIFGNNKTWRGPIIMALGTYIFILFFGKLLVLFKVDQESIIFSYASATSWKGIFYGLAYSLGELPNSFLKRRLDILPGAVAKNNLKKKFFSIIDNIDSLLACAVVLLFLYKIPLSYVGGAIFLGGGLHYLTDTLMRFWKLKK